MTDWCADQLPAIARRVLAEEQDGRPADPHRRARAEWVLADEAGRSMQPQQDNRIPHMTDQDHRVQCIACAHYVGGWCRNALAAKLSTRQPEAQVGRAFAVLKQDCNGYKVKENK